MTITSKAHGASYTQSIQSLQEKLNIPIKKQENEIKLIAIRYSMAILVTKIRFENNQRPPILEDLSYTLESIHKMACINRIHSQYKVYIYLHLRTYNKNNPK